MGKGKLYLVATPIGNLEDITFRALRVLKEVDLIAAEDTRHSLKLLNYFEISKPLISYHRHNEENKTEKLINKLLNGENIAIITDAGTPAISDPGEDIVKEAIENNIEIIPVPGACALINALICSGMDTSEFSFFGFLPLNKKNRREKLEQIKSDNTHLVGQIPTPEVASMLSASDIFCLPSFSEGFPTCVIEACVARNYIITTYRGDAKEIVKSPEHGIILPDNNEDGVYNAIISVLDSPEKRRVATDLCYQTVVNNYTWKHTADAFLKLIDEIQ